MPFTPAYAEPALPMVSTLGPWGLSVADANTGNATVSATWESANRAVYMPILVPTTCVATRVWWANGATTTGGATIEVGIYASSGYEPAGKLVSGSAVQGTASQVQFVDTTDVTLTPGLWWIAIVASSATNTTVFRLSVSTDFDASRRFQQASASPLPSTATVAESAANNIWLCGFSTTTIT